MPQKVFRDCLGSKRLILTLAEIVTCLKACFESGLRGCWTVVVGTLYATFSPKDSARCCLTCGSMFIVVVREC